MIRQGLKSPPEAACAHGASPCSLGSTPVPLTSSFRPTVNRTVLTAVDMAQPMNILCSLTDVGQRRTAASGAMPAAGTKALAGALAASSDRTGRSIHSNAAPTKTKATIHPTVRQCDGSRRARATARATRPPPVRRGRRRPRGPAEVLVRRRLTGRSPRPPFSLPRDRQRWVTA